MTNENYSLFKNKWEIKNNKKPHQSLWQLCWDHNKWARKWQIERKENANQNGLWFNVSGFDKATSRKFRDVQIFQDLKSTETQINLIESQNK